MSENPEQKLVIFIGDRPPFEDRVGILHFQDKRLSTCTVEFANGKVAVANHDIWAIDIWNSFIEERTLQEFFEASHSWLIKKLLPHIVRIEQEVLQPYNEFLRRFFSKESCQKIKLNVGVFTIVVPDERCPQLDVGIVETDGGGMNLFRVRCRTQTVTEHADNLIPLVQIEPKDENGVFRIIQEVLAQKLRLMRALTLTYASLTGTQVSL